MYISCCLAVTFNNTSVTSHSFIIATKYPAWCPGQRRDLGCEQEPAGNLGPNKTLPLPGSLPSSGMCDSFPARLPQTTTRLENRAADPRWHSCGIVCSPGWCVTVAPLASSIVKPYSVQSAGAGSLCAVIQMTAAGTSLVHTVELRG